MPVALVSLLLSSCGGAGTPQAEVVVEIPETKGSRAPKPPKAAPAAASAAPLRDRNQEALEREEVRRASETIFALRPQFSHCFLAYLPGVQKRKVVIEFTVERDGSARNMKLTPALGLPALDECLRRVLSRTQFDPPSLDVAKVRVPLKIP